MFTTRILRNLQKPVVRGSQRIIKQQSAANAIFTDYATYPLTFAILTSVGLIVVFAGRKLIYHPDVSVSSELRFAPEVQHESPLRLHDADLFRKQTRKVSEFLVPKTAAILKATTGQDELGDKWNLDFVRNQNIDVPLEQTDFFDDGLYPGIESTDFSANRDNGSI